MVKNLIKEKSSNKENYQDKKERKYKNKKTKLDRRQILFLFVSTLFFFFLLHPLRVLLFFDLLFFGCLHQLK